MQDLSLLTQDLLNPGEPEKILEISEFSMLRWDTPNLTIAPWPGSRILGSRGSCTGGSDREMFK